MQKDQPLVIEKYRSNKTATTATRIRGCGPKQMDAIEEYFRNGYNKKAAAQKVGYRGEGGSHTMWGLPQVKKEIERRARVREDKRVRVEKRLDLTEERIMAEMVKIAFAPLRGEVAIINESNPEGAAELMAEKAGIGALTPVDPRDKSNALRDLAKIKGMFTDHIKIDGEMSLVERLQAGRARVALNAAQEEEDEMEQESDSVEVT